MEGKARQRGEQYVKPIQRLQKSGPQPIANLHQTVPQERVDLALTAW